MRKMKIWGGAIVLALVATACGTVGKTAPDQIAIHYSDGMWENQEFKDCLQPSKRERTGMGDVYYYYPANQRFLDATGGPNKDFDPITVVSKDNVELRIPITVNFFLKTEDCNVLRTFHEQVGRRFEAWMGEGDTKTSDGWKRMLDVIIRQPLDTTLDRIAQGYNWRDLYNDPQAKTEIERQVNEQIATLVKRQTNNEEFFRNWSALVQKPTPVNQDLANAIAAEQNSVADARAREAKARADRAAAEAQVAVARAEAAKERELIKVLGLEGYLRLKAIQAGMNPFQPQYGQPVKETP